MTVGDFFREVRYSELDFVIRTKDWFKTVEEYEVKRGTYGNHPELPNHIWNSNINSISIHTSGTMVIEIDINEEEKTDEEKRLQELYKMVYDAQKAGDEEHGWEYEEEWQEMIYGAIQELEHTMHMCGYRR